MVRVTRTVVVPSVVLTRRKYEVLRELGSLKRCTGR